MTPTQLADASMREVKEMSYSGMIVIDHSDLKEILRSVAKRSYEMGHEHGVGMGRKIERTGMKSTRASRELDKVASGLMHKMHKSRAAGVESSSDEEL